MSWQVEIRNIGQNTAAGNRFNYGHEAFIEISLSLLGNLRTQMSNTFKLQVFSSRFSLSPVEHRLFIQFSFLQVTEQN